MTARTVPNQRESISILELMDMFPDEVAARAWLAND